MIFSNPVYRFKPQPFKIILILASLLIVFYTLITIKYLITPVEEKILKNNNSFCIVLTSEKTISKRATVVWNTWGQHCDNIVFACNCDNVLRANNLTKENKKLPDDIAQFKGLEKLPILNLNFAEDYKRMGEKVLMILRLIYKVYSSDYKWFIMADDDTYIFVDNLNKFSSKNDHNMAYMYGFVWRIFVPGGYISGGAGTLYTQEAFKRIGKLIDANGCDKYIDAYGDITIGNCAVEANITIGNSNDEFDRSRFNPSNPKEHYYGPLPSPLTQAGSHNGKIGKECCSLETISFHYVSPEDMYAIYANKTFLKDLLT